jgi:hypothetical protein
MGYFLISYNKIKKIAILSTKDYRFHRDFDFIHELTQISTKDYP